MGPISYQTRPSATFPPHQPSCLPPHHPRASGGGSRAWSHTLSTLVSCPPLSYVANSHKLSRVGSEVEGFGYRGFERRFREKGPESVLISCQFSYVVYSYAGFRSQGLGVRDRGFVAGVDVVLVRCRPSYVSRLSYAANSHKLSCVGSLRFRDWGLGYRGFMAGVDVGARFREEGRDLQGSVEGGCQHLSSRAVSTCRHVLSAPVITSCPGRDRVYNTRSQHAECLHVSVCAHTTQSPGHERPDTYTGTPGYKSAGCRRRGQRMLSAPVLTSSFD